MSDHLSSLRLKGLSTHLIEACTAPFSWKKCKCQHFLSSVVELLQEQFSNIFSAPLREIYCTGVRWWGHCEPWLGKGWPDPIKSRNSWPNQHLVTVSSFQSLFRGIHSPSIPPIPAYLLPFTCWQSGGNSRALTWMESGFHLFQVLVSRLLLFVLASLMLQVKSKSEISIVCSTLRESL